jgi:23S rRNA (cytosine1962-C5)-methyltransferase
VFYDYGSGQGETLQNGAAEWRERFGWESVSRIDRGVAGDEGRAGNIALAGSAPETLVVREGNLRFRLEPRHPRNVGLFLDTRELRNTLQNVASGARVLNLFAYTGSLGLAALAGGAVEVVQVDISARYLDWARENLRLNDLPEAACRFKVMDSERYLDWAMKKGLTFDHIILDPPVFSRFEGKVFRWADDYFRLAEKCAALLAPGGSLHAVTNYSGITAPEFAAGLRDAAHRAGRHAPLPRRMPLPADFDLPKDATDLPEGNALIFQLTSD